MIRAFWHSSRNFGDTLTAPVVEHFTGKTVGLAPRNETGKLVAIGSVLTAVRTRDVVWTTGSIREEKYPAHEGAKFLAVRGPLTRALIINAEVPEVYGDGALLLPLMFRPKVEKAHKIGFVPHYMDFGTEEARDKAAHLATRFGCEVEIIDVCRPWKEVVIDIMACEQIFSSSLHGIIVAEAYGVPATWCVISARVIGGAFKFKDYIAGTGREIQDPGPLPPIPDLIAIQAKLILPLKQHFS